MAELILASASPRRRELMKLITDDFEVEASSFDEDGINENDPFLLVRVLSLSKASTIKSKSDDVVIGCDTVVFLDGEILQKPKTAQEAAAMLKRLSGRTHSVITGVSILENNNVHQFECETLVTFYELSDDEIEYYVSTDEPYDKAGGYGIQEHGGLFVEKIEGDYQNVVGLPVSKVYRSLSELRTKEGEPRFNFQKNKNYKKML